LRRSQVKQAIRLHRKLKSTGFYFNFDQSEQLNSYLILPIHIRELLKASGKKLFITGSQSSRLPIAAFVANKPMRAGRPQSG
jgi:hypothetical protein